MMMNNQDVSCVSKIHEQTNTRIYDRNIPSQMLQPYLNVRPVMTKYSHFPIVDPRKELNVKTPFNAVEKWYQLEPEIFKNNPKSSKGPFIQFKKSNQTIIPLNGQNVGLFGLNVLIISLLHNVTCKMSHR